MTELPAASREGEGASGGTENASIFRIVLRDRPNSRAARLTLIPSTCTARRTRAYTSTLSTSQVSQKHTSPVLFD